MVELETSVLSLRSSPTVRGETQLGFAIEILRISALIPFDTVVRPGPPYLLNFAQ